MTMTPLTSADRANYFMKISAQYTNNGYERIKRHWDYCNDKEGEVPTTVPITFIIGGALFGAKFGNEIGKEIEKVVVQENTEGQFGGFVGGSFGLILGAGAGGFIYMKFIEQSANYKKFIALGIDNAIKQSITYNYSGDLILENFCCPVSLCVMDIPAFTPSGVIYDYNFLINCPRETNGHIKDPNKNPSFHENDVVFHFESAFIIKKRISFLMKQDLQTLNNNPVLKHSLEKEYKKIERACTSFYEEARGVIENRRKERTTTSLQYKKEIQEFENLFGTDDIQEIDWNTDWQATLKARWQSFYPDANILNQ